MTLTFRELQLHNQVVLDHENAATLAERQRCAAIVYDHSRGDGPDLTQLDKDINDVLTQIVAAIEAGGEG